MTKPNKVPLGHIYAKEIPKEVTVTMQEIADWKECDVEQLKIK